MNPEPSTPTMISDENLGDIQIGYAESTPESQGDGETTPTTPVETSAPVASPETPPEPPKPVITIDKTNLSKELLRLEKEDPEFANQFNINVGNKAARKYKPIIDNLTAERDAAVNELRRREMLALPDNEKAEKFANDPAWATEYARLVHTKPEEVVAQRRMVMEREQINTTLLDTFEEARTAGLDDAHVTAVMEEVKSGKFDRDADGNILNPYISIARIQKALTDRLLESVRSTNTPVLATPKQEPVAPTPNQALIAPGPDTSVTGTVRAGGSRDPVSDYQRVLREGKTMSSEEIDKITAKYLTME